MIAVKNFKSAAQGLVVRAIQTVVNVRERHARRSALDRWMLAIDRMKHGQQWSKIMGRKLLLKERTFQEWSKHAQHEFSIWVRQYQSAARRKRSLLMSFLLAWRHYAAHGMRLETMRRMIRSRAAHWNNVKVIRAWHKCAVMKADMFARTEHSCHMLQHHAFMAWRAALTNIYRHRTRFLKGAVILKVVDMRSISWAFSAWRAVRDNFREKVRMGIFTSAIINKAVRVMVKACLIEWKRLTRTGAHLRFQIMKQGMHVRHNLLAQCMVNWMYSSLKKEKRDERKEAHGLVVKMRVLQAWFRLTKIIERLRTRSLFWKQMTTWNRWVEFLREEHRLRLQLPYNTGEVVPRDDEMRQYRFPC